MLNSQPLEAYRLRKQMTAVHNNIIHTRYSGSKLVVSGSVYTGLINYLGDVYRSYAVEFSQLWW